MSQGKQLNYWIQIFFCFFFNFWLIFHFLCIFLSNLILWSVIFEANFEAKCLNTVELKMQAAIWMNLVRKRLRALLLHLGMPHCESTFYHKERTYTRIHCTYRYLLHTFLSPKCWTTARVRCYSKLHIFQLVPWNVINHSNTANLSCYKCHL